VEGLVDDHLGGVESLGVVVGLRVGGVRLPLGQPSGAYPKAVAHVGAFQGPQAEVGGVAVGNGVGVVHQRGAGAESGALIEDRGELLVADLQQVGGLTGGGLIGGGDGGHRVANMAGHSGQHILVRDLAAVAAQRLDLRGGEDDHLRGKEGGVDAGHAGGGAWGPHQPDVPHPGDGEVVGVADGGADAGVGHRLAACGVSAAGASVSRARRTSTAIILVR
jgi:hypothetical protein